jgi:hypothetical protein
MSRAYRMEITVGDGDEEGGLLTSIEIHSLGDTIQEMWDVEEESPVCHGVQAYYGENALFGGESEEDFSDRVSLAVWESLGRYIPVEIAATCLEHIPSESHFRDEEDYKRLIRDELPDDDCSGGTRG